MLTVCGCSPFAAWARALLTGVSAMHMHRQCAAVSPVLSVQPLCQTSWRTQVGRKLDWGDLFPFWHMVLQAKLLISA